MFELSLFENLNKFFLILCSFFLNRNNQKIEHFRRNDIVLYNIYSSNGNMHFAFKIPLMKMLLNRKEVV